MADDLNPYRTWLNVASDAQPPNHYELLGLSPHRADPASVAEAFRRQADLITPHLTGQRLELAQQVMTELINARMVLSTPTTKKAYDAELTPAPRGKAPDSSSTSMPRPQALPPACDPQPDGAAPGADSFGPTSVDSLLPPTSGSAAAVPSASPLPLGGAASTPQAAAATPQPLAAAPVNQPPVPFATAPAVPRALPVAAAPAYGYPQPSAMPMMAQPVMAQPVRAHPVGYTSPATPIMAQPVLPSAPAPVGAEPVLSVGPSTFSAPQRLQRRRTSVAPTIAGVGIAGLLVAGGVLWVVKHEKPVAQAPAGAGHLPNDGRNASRRVQGPEQPEPAKPRLPQTKPEPKEQKLFGPLPTTKPDPVPTAEDPDSSGPKPLTPLDNSKAIVTTPAKTEPNSPQPTTEPTKPAPDPPTPNPPEPKPPAPEPKPPSAEEAAAVKKALATARAKLSARKPAAAQDVLAEALLSAESPESIRQIDNLEALCQYADNFWRAVRDEMSKLEAGEELTVGDQQVAIVEASQDGLTVRVAGRNHDYRLDNLPVKLALFLARRWLAEDDPQSRLVVAAFLLFDPQGDREEARRLIAEAEQSGADAAAFKSELEAASASR